MEGVGIRNPITYARPQSIQQASESSDVGILLKQIVIGIQTALTKAGSTIYLLFDS
jgi:hypothetical protein